MDITVKFSGKEYHVENIADDATISSLKARLYHDTRVKPEHQRLMGIKTQQGEFITFISFPKSFFCICQHYFLTNLHVVSYELIVNEI